jgi:hypothetical protein
MRFRPAALIVRFGSWSPEWLVAAEPCLILAERAFCARAIFRLTAALRFQSLLQQRYGAIAERKLNQANSHRSEMICC